MLSFRYVFLFVALVYWIPVSAQQDPSYVFSLESQDVELESTFTSFLSVENIDGDEVVGLQGAVCHDSEYLTLDFADFGADGAALPSTVALVFLDVGDEDEGYAFAILLNVIISATISPGDLLPEFVEATYIVDGPLAAAGETTDLTLCDDVLGDPTVTQAVIFGGTDTVPTLIDATITLHAISQPFIRGDCNDDGDVTLLDAIEMLGEIFVDDPLGSCAAACDANADGEYSIGDPLQVLEYLFVSGISPAAPFPDCGDGAVTEPCESQGTCQ